MTTLTIIVLAAIVVDALLRIRAAYQNEMRHLNLATEIDQMKERINGLEKKALVWKEKSV